MNRREFLATTAGGLVSTIPIFAALTPPIRPKKILVLGGTYFLGPAVVQYALDQGHEITLFNRGKTNPGLFAAVEHICGDRDPHSPNLSRLQGTRKWDAVIDVWPSDPHVVAATARLLQDRVSRYVFVSTIVAYKDLRKIGVVESDPLFDDLTNAEAWYEYDKAQCERVLQQIYGERHSVCRSHIINGYGNDSDTFRFWLVRIDRGGEVLAPGDGTDPVQFTDVKDVGAFVLKVAANDLPGAYNVAGPIPGKLTFRQLIEQLNMFTGNKAKLVWVSDAFLQANHIEAFRTLAMWVPVQRARKPGFMQINQKKALDAGLTFRRIELTAEDELKWFRETMPRDYEFGVGKSNKGFPRARELELLAAWRSQSQRAS
ncbi:MAG TPA: NAD-dependent epimerase/dehydratase family protein [Chthoniobacterales bacterium]|jgi:2'-hydroxyisoflavone reductase